MTHQPRKGRNPSNKQRAANRAPSLGAATHSTSPRIGHSSGRPVVRLSLPWFRSWIGGSLVNLIVAALVALIVGGAIYWLLQIRSLAVGARALGASILLAGVVGIALFWLLQRAMIAHTIGEFEQELRKRLDQDNPELLLSASVRELRGPVDVLNQLLSATHQRIRLATAIQRVFTAKAQLADLDDLTGLYNKKFLQEYLDDEVSRTLIVKDSLSAIMIDVDHFKHYNDTNGHQAGDEVLRTIARLLRDQTRALDINVRYGGEEFLVILPRTSLERATRSAERIRRAVEQCDFANTKSQPQGRLTISLGVASLPRHAQDGQELIAKADAALYAAKTAGRNAVRTADELKAA